MTGTTNRQRERKAAERFPDCDPVEIPLGPTWALLQLLRHFVAEFEEAAEEHEDAGREGLAKLYRSRAARAEFQRALLAPHVDAHFHACENHPTVHRPEGDPTP